MFLGSTFCRSSTPPRSALSLPFRNPRHQHEYKKLRRLPLCNGFVLIAGVVDSTTNYVEHSEVVAERIERAVAVTEAQRASDRRCHYGFGTFACYEFCAEEIA
jgi:5-methyltetrahydropteroyltriglutamate--homocysteine methyltransferase